MSIYEEIRSSGSNKKRDMEGYYQRQKDPFGLEHEMDQYEVVFSRIKDMLGVELPNPYSLIEYGCSEGQLFQEWLKIFPNCNSYIGVDISPTAISRFDTASLAGSMANISLHVGDMEENEAIKALGSSSDILLFHESLQYLDKPSKALKEIFSYAKSGSYIIISDGMKRPVVRFYLRDREPYKNQCRVVAYEPIKCRTYKGTYYNRFTTIYQKL